MPNNHNIKRFASLEVMRMAKALLRSDRIDVLAAARMLVLGAKYEYVITEGGEPEGEGWEHSPHSKNPNSYRRRTGLHPNEKVPESKPARNYKAFDASRIPEKMKNVMMKALDFDVDYFEQLRDGYNMMSGIRKVVGEDYLDTDTADYVSSFADSGYGKSDYPRRELSNIACNVMGVNPDGYCLNSKKELDEQDRKDAETFVKASQLIASMTGLVDEEGYVTAYRGTKDQYDRGTGKYRGSNCESWTVNPDKVFREGQIVKARIPVERILGCFAGNMSLYPCKEDEITCCTNDLDLECEELTGSDDSSTAEDYDMGMESFMAQERIANNIRKMFGEE